MTDETTGRSAWHRLGSTAETNHDKRAADPDNYPDGRWCAPKGSDSGVKWLEWGRLS